MANPRLSAREWFLSPSSGYRQWFFGFCSLKSLPADSYPASLHRDTITASPFLQDTVELFKCCKLYISHTSRWPMVTWSAIKLLGHTLLASRVLMCRLGWCNTGWGYVMHKPKAIALCNRASLKASEVCTNSNEVLIITFMDVLHTPHKNHQTTVLEVLELSFSSAIL